jgi:hypothetical protein
VKGLHSSGSVAICCERGNEPLTYIKAGNFHGVCNGTKFHCELVCLAACDVACYFRNLLFSHSQPCEALITMDSIISSMLYAVNVSAL